MSKLSINALKQLFKTGLKPDQSAFWNWMDSFWHKDEKISLNSLDGLQDELDKYATKEYVDNSGGTGGSGIKSATIDANGDLIITLSDDSTLNAGNAKGADGVIGIDGKSAYELSVQNGFTGTVQEWLLSLVGAKGDKGDKGDTGAQGLQGIQGEKGDTGAQGAQGIQGEKGDKGDTGAQGLQGIQGEKGDTGAQGAQGIQGIQGVAGKSAYQTSIENGYTGTEVQFNTDLQKVSDANHSTYSIVTLSKTAWNANLRQTKTIAGISGKKIFAFALSDSTNNFTEAAACMTRVVEDLSTGNDLVFQVEVIPDIDLKIKIEIRD